MIPQQPLLPWKISLTALHGIAILSASLRFGYRRRTRRLWWDDHAALIAAVIESLNVAVLWMRLQHFDTEDVMIRKLKVNLSYTNSVCFAAVIWWPRISMALAIVRITPEWSKLRRVMLWITFFFILNWIALTLAFTITCAVHQNWKYIIADILVCGPGYKVTPASISADIVSDVLLTVLPVRHLWNLTLPGNQRRLVLVVFSTSLLTLMAAIAVVLFSYARTVKTPGELLVWLMVLQIEEAVSVIASNLTVLISWGYRAFMGGEDMDKESEKYITPHWSQSPVDHTQSFVLNEITVTLNGDNSQLSTSDTSVSPRLHLDDRSQIQGCMSSKADNRPAEGSSDIEKG